jgi:hypothetical protein
MKKANQPAHLLPAEVVSARLRELAELSWKTPPAAHSIDRSASAVTTRLLECAEISALVWELAKAGPR